jgi:predicted Fe-S protein YdhL (DUF1289 family)
MNDRSDSPCIGVCQIDEAGYCIGCGRSADEIFGNSDSSEPASEVEVVRAPVHPGQPHPED